MVRQGILALDEVAHGSDEYDEARRDNLIRPGGGHIGQGAVRRG